MRYVQWTYRARVFVCVWVCVCVCVCTWHVTLHALRTMNISSHKLNLHRHNNLQWHSTFFSAWALCHQETTLDYMKKSQEKQNYLKFFWSCIKSQETTLDFESQEKTLDYIKVKRKLLTLKSPKSRENSWLESQEKTHTWENSHMRKLLIGARGQ